MNTRVARLFTGDLEPIVYGPLRGDDGNVLYPSAATFVLTDGNVSIPTPAGTFTIDLDTGLTTYEWTSSEASALTAELPRSNVRVRWTFTVAGDPVERTQYIDVVEIKLRTNVNDSDLIQRYGLLREHRPRLQGVASGGSLTTVIDTRVLATYEPQFFLSSFVEMITGGSKRARVRVTLFDAVDATLTVEPAFPYAIEANETYAIEFSYESQVSAAYRRLERFVREWVGDTQSLRRLDGLDFTDVHLALSLQYACESLVREEGDEFDLAKGRFSQEFDLALSELRVKFDTGATNQDGDSENIYVKPLYRYWGQ